MCFCRKRLVHSHCKLWVHMFMQFKFVFESVLIMNSREVREKFFNFFTSKKHVLHDSAPIVIKDDPTLFFLQNLRDEVHRYAIAGHRLKSKKTLFKNPLDEITGIGANRKKSLLEEF